MSVVLVELEAQGGPGEVVNAFTEFGNLAREAGARVLIEDPTALASGRGRFAVEMEAPDWDYARTVVESMIAQVPGAVEVFAIATAD